jgi:hypothetical protein
MEAAESLVGIEKPSGIREIAERLPPEERERLLELLEKLG